MFQMLIPLLGGAIGLLFPGAPSWTGEFVGHLLAALVELVDDAGDLDDLKGPDRLAWVVAHAEEAVSEAFDDIPEWHALPKARRERIVGGLAELVLFIGLVSNKRRRRKLIRRVRRGI